MSVPEVFRQWQKGWIRCTNSEPDYFEEENNSQWQIQNLNSLIDSIRELLRMAWENKPNFCTSQGNICNSKAKFEADSYSANISLF
jgi:hypothetical protein